MSGRVGRRDFGSIRRMASGRYQARYRHPYTGMEHRGPQTFGTKADAGRFLDRVRVDIERGAWRDPRLGRVTFAAWSETYSEAALHKRATTRVTHDSILKNHLVPSFGPMPLGAIVPADIQRFVQKLVADELRPSTVRTVYGLLRNIFNAAVERDILATSPCRGVKVPAKEGPDVRFLAPEELSVLAALISEPYRSMVYLGGVLGMRWSEITGLRVKRVDPLGKKLLVTETLAQVGGFADVKSKASRRTLPLPDFMVQMLAEHMALRGLSGDQADELLFVGPRGGRLWYSNWHKREWAPAIEAAGLQGFTFHGLRHTSVALMVELKTHPKEIQTRLGHSSFSTTMDIYGHVLASTADGVTEGMQKMFTGADGTAMARTLQGGSQSGS